MDGGADLDDHTFAHSGPDQGLADALLRALSRPVALSQERLASSQERLALSQNRLALRQDRRSLAQALVDYGRTAEAPRKRKRSSDLLCDKDEIGRRFLVARRLANGCYGWSTSWAREHYPDRCSTQDAMKSFLRQARRYAKCVEGVSASSQAVVKASSRAVVKASSQAFPSRRASSQALVAASCTPALAHSKRRRKHGGGGPGTMKSPELGEELFAWFVDSISNVKGRLPSGLLLSVARGIAQDLVQLHAEQKELGQLPPHADLCLPVLNSTWLKRWRRLHGISWRTVNLRFKSSRDIVKKRLRIFWSNVLRVRFLHRLLEPMGELVFEGFDQTPLWFTASSQEKTLALRGSRKVAVKENLPMSRSRFTAMTRCRWPAPPQDGKEIALLFRASGGGVRIREGLRVPPGVLLQFQEKGSYRLPDVLEYLEWVLDRSRVDLRDAGSALASSQETRAVTTQGSSQVEPQATRVMRPSEKSALGSRPQTRGRRAEKPQPGDPALASSQVAGAAEIEHTEAGDIALASSQVARAAESKKVDAGGIALASSQVARAAASKRVDAGGIALVSSQVARAAESENLEAGDIAVASSQVARAAESEKRDYPEPSMASSPGRRVVYLLDWFAPHLDPAVDELVHSVGHAILRIGGHLTGLVQVEDTHAHGPMTAAYKRRESLEAYQQLVVRPDRLPSTSRQTVMERAFDSWMDVSHEKCSQGFVANGIANALDGSEDGHLSADVEGFWHEVGMPELRKRIEREMEDVVASRQVQVFAEYTKVLQEYDAHAPLREGQEAFGIDIGDDDGEDPRSGSQTPDEGFDHLGNDSDGDPPAAPPRSPPPLPPPSAPRAVDNGVESSKHGFEPSVAQEHPMFGAAQKALLENKAAQEKATTAALDAVLAMGGDPLLEETLRKRLRTVQKKAKLNGLQPRVHIHAVSLQRKQEIMRLREESKAEEVKQKELALTLRLRQAEAEIAKAKEREESRAAKAALEEEKRRKVEGERLRANEENKVEILRMRFAASLAGQLEGYLQDFSKGPERIARASKRALEAAKKKAGLDYIDVPMFWKPNIAGMRVLKHHPRIGLPAKATDTLLASPEFSGWLERHKVGKELSDPRHAFRKVVERLMPDYFTVLGGRHGVDVLLAESRQSCDLAFLAANWRYTHIVGADSYRMGLSAWPPRDDWFDAPMAAGKLASSQGASASSQGAAAEKSVVVAGRRTSAPSHVGKAGAVKASPDDVRRSKAVASSQATAAATPSTAESGSSHRRLAAVWAEAP